MHPRRPRRSTEVPAARSCKRKSLPPQDEDEPDTKLSKTRAAQDITNTPGAWRSTRNAGMVVDYEGEVVKTLTEVIFTSAEIMGNSEGRSTSECHNSYADRLAR